MRGFAGFVNWFGIHAPTSSRIRSASLIAAGMGDLQSGANVDEVQPSEIALIEICKDPAEIPATLTQSPCGAIFIWTK